MNPPIRRHHGSVLLLTALAVCCPFVTRGYSAAPPAGGRELPVVATLEGHRDGVRRLLFSPDGGSLLTHGPDKLLLWNIKTQTSTAVVPERGTPNPWFSPARFSPDGKSIFLEYLGQDADVYDIGTGTRRGVESNPRGEGCFSPDGLSQVRFRLDGASMHRLTKPFDAGSADKGQPLDVPPQMTVMGELVGISPFTLKGDVLAVKGKDRNIQLWQVTEGKRTAVLPKSQGSWFTFSPDGKLLAAECGVFVQSIASPSGVKEPTIKVFDAATGRERATLTLDPNDPPIRFVVFSPDSRLVASASNYTVKVWNATTGKLVAAMEKPKAVMNPSIVIRKDGRMLAGLSGDTVLVWNASTGKLLHTIAQACSTPDFSPDGQTLAVGHDKGVVRIYRLP